MDGFYDVHGINSNAVVQGKMPRLVDLEAISVSDDLDHEVILVNRATDVELRQLEERVSFMSRECRALMKLPLSNIMIQKIAALVVDRMGGSVNDAEEMSRRWIARSFELRISLNSIVLPLGCLNVGLSRHRALLFKVVRASIPRFLSSYFWLPFIALSIQFCSISVTLLIKLYALLVGPASI